MVADVIDVVIQSADITRKREQKEDNLVEQCNAKGVACLLVDRVPFLELAIVISMPEVENNEVVIVAAENA
jgi:thymidine kinase